MLKMEVEQAEAYVCRHRQELAKKHLPATSDILRGDPAEEIVRVTHDQRS
jgi:hypothetical protein